MRKLKVINVICYILFLTFTGSSVYRLILTDDIKVAKICAFLYIIGLTIVTTISTISTINR